MFLSSELSKLKSQLDEIKTKIEDLKLINDDNLIKEFNESAEYVEKKQFQKMNIIHSKILKII